MSISTATDRLSSPRRLPRGQIVAALLAAIGLIGAVVAIAVSSATSSPGRVSARPGTISLTRPSLAAQPTPAVTTAAHGYFRDPVTHALAPVGTSVVSSAAPRTPRTTPGPGHR